MFATKLKPLPSNELPKALPWFSPQTRSKVGHDPCKTLTSLNLFTAALLLHENNPTKSDVSLPALHPHAHP